MKIHFFYFFFFIFFLGGGGSNQGVGWGRGVARFGLGG